MAKSKYAHQSHDPRAVRLRQNRHFTMLRLAAMGRTIAQISRAMKLRRASIYHHLENHCLCFQQEGDYAATAERYRQWRRSKLLSTPLHYPES